MRNLINRGARKSPLLLVPLVWVFVLLLQPVNAQDAPRVEQRVSKTFGVTGVPRVRLETFDGRISVHARNKPEVMVTFIKSAHNEHEMNGITILANENRGEFIAAATFDKAFSREVLIRNQRVLSNSASVDLEVYVPQEVILYVMSGDGGINAEGMNGSLDLSTRDGAIEVRNSRARIRARTSDGPIQIENSFGDVSVNTEEGPIKLDGIFTQLIASTNEGEVTFVVREGTNAFIETTSEHVSNQVSAISDDVPS